MTRSEKTQVLVVGAGPVGLFAALSLAERGLAVRIVDQGWRTALHSYALALHGDTLRMLEPLGVTRDLLELGSSIDRVAIYRGPDQVGTVDLDQLDGRFRSLLVLPQAWLERALERRLRSLGVDVLWNHELTGLEIGPSSVKADILAKHEVGLAYPGNDTGWMPGSRKDVEAEFVIGADGYHSKVRAAIDVDYVNYGSAQNYLLFEFLSPIVLQREMRLIFDDLGTSVLWPLSNLRGRFGFEVLAEDWDLPDMARLEEQIAHRAPWFDPPPEEVYWTTQAFFERRLADPIGRGRVWITGDAAHVTCPVGVQTMNVSFRECHDLAERLSAILQGGGGLDTLDAFAGERRQEWRGMLGLDGDASCTDKAPEWVHELTAVLPQALPASGPALAQLLGQLGMSLPQGAAQSSNS